MDIESCLVYTAESLEDLFVRFSIDISPELKRFFGSDLVEVLGIDGSPEVLETDRPECT